MIHIKETEIIPFLKTAQTGYTKMISKRKSQEGGKNQWQKRIKASVCFLKWDAERR